MSRLAVIVGFGGISPAGRSSFHHAYRRMVYDALSESVLADTYRDLATIMNLPESNLSYNGQNPRHYINQHTLVRQLEDQLFDPAAMLVHHPISAQPVVGEAIQFVCKATELPAAIPIAWQIETVDDVRVKVTIHDQTRILVPGTRQSPVNSAGQLPRGFEPGLLYQSRHHPRGLQIAVYGASDAIYSMGIDWQKIMTKVPPDQVSVYAGSCMSQLDYNGLGGMLQARLLGKRVTSKQCPLGFAQMPADFINAYVLGSVGTTGTGMGACATFLYNLQLGLNDIRSGKCRVAVVGTSEANVTPEVMEGYTIMGALAKDEELKAIDNTETADFQRASRPFGDNCGFTMAESSQFVVLFDDELALELGATIHGAIGDVTVNADGFKKSISSPGIGNYLTVSKALATTRAIIGEKGLRNHTYMQAHGTSTPQNRVTESHILSESAKAFGIDNWSISAIKSYLGHTLASSSGDQLMVSLGVWKYGVIPGITSIDKVADDVCQQNLSFELQHKEVAIDEMQATLLNAKGFGGNNASASILSPFVAQAMLEKKHGQATMKVYRQQNENVQEQSEQYNQKAIAGDAEPIYKFGKGVLSGNDVQLSAHALELPGFDLSVNLDAENPYEDMS